MADFVAIDLETANPSMASICQIGLVRYANGALVEDWSTYVDPQDYFDNINISIHGIDESKVKGAPTFPEIYRELTGYLTGSVVVCHTHFDRVALYQAAKRHAAVPPECRWLDSAKVARRTWEACAWKGYGLSDVCKMLGHDFKHHDALEDARAAAQVLLAAIAESGLEVEDWLLRIGQPINLAGVGEKGKVARSGNPEGALYGEMLVFTGSLTMPREQAADLAAKVGCEVATGITKKTTMLVVGDHDILRLGGHEKSSKHRKAEELMAKGQRIRILQESDFLELVAMASDGE